MVSFTKPFEMPPIAYVPLHSIVWPCLKKVVILNILFKEEIGNDLVFTYTACASPSLLIKDISIAS